MRKFVLIFFILFAKCAWSTEYTANIREVNVKLNKNIYQLNAKINYKLSPISKEAIQKGISLTWVIIIKLQQQGFFWDSTLKTIKMDYQIQNHALLNLYSVKKATDGTTTLFSTLAAALNSISNIHNLTVIERQLIDPNKQYYLALKVLFNREKLPVPLRPMSYFNSDWALSSPWSIWQLQN